MTAFTWLNSLMVWLGEWVPRLIFIPVTHTGVLLQRAGRVTELAPGVSWYWPKVATLRQIAMTERTILTSGQLIDGRLVVVVIVWKVTDAVAAVTTYRDFKARLEDEVRRHVANAKGNTTEALGAVRHTFAGVLDISAITTTSEGWVLPVKNFGDTAFREPDGD